MLKRTQIDLVSSVLGRLDKRPEGTCWSTGTHPATVPRFVVPSRHSRRPWPRQTGALGRPDLQDPVRSFHILPV